MLFFHVSSRTSSKLTNSKRFVEQIFSALKDMKEVLTLALTDEKGAATAAAAVPATASPTASITASSSAPAAAAPAAVPVSSGGRSTSSGGGKGKGASGLKVGLLPTSPGRHTPTPSPAGSTAGSNKDGTGGSSDKDAAR